MEGWEEMSFDSFRAGQVLIGARRFRSSVSRAYYAAYAALTGELSRTKGVIFNREGKNPSHAQLAMLVGHNLDKTRHPDWRIKEFRRRLSVLLKARVAADYFPSAAHDRSLALDCIRHASFILRELGLEP